MANNFEDVIAQEKGAFEPQRQHTWLITFFDLPGADVLELSLRTGFLPNISNEEIEIPYMNARVYVAGKYMVDSGTLSINDYVDKNTAKIINDWQQLIYNPFTGAMGYARNYKKRGNIILLSPDFAVERIWELVGCWPQAINYGTIDYSSSDVVMLDMTLKYDKALPKLAA